MFRLLKLCVSLAAFCALAYFGMTVKLGSRTLFEHLRAIGQTKESQELVDGTKEAAEPLVDDVRRRIGQSHADHADHAEKDDKTAKTEKTGRDDEPGDKPDKQAHAQATPDAGAAPRDDFSPSERRRLRHLLGAVEHHASRE